MIKTKNELLLTLDIFSNMHHKRMQENATDNFGFKPYKPQGFLYRCSELALETYSYYTNKLQGS